MIHIVTTWDTESPCRGLFEQQVCFQRDWVDGSGVVMDTCETYGVPATFMVNVGEIDYWREEPTNAEMVVQEMHRRGHDVQVHLHTAWAFWWCDGEEPYYDPELDVLDDGLRRFPVGEPETPWTQRFFLARGRQRLEQITGVQPTGYRDVHYDFDDARVFYALWREGFTSDWSFEKGVRSNLSRHLPQRFAVADPLPDHAYWPDWLEPRRPAQECGWPVVEIPNFSIDGTDRRLDFSCSVDTLGPAFDRWYETARQRPCAVCSLLNHQKREIFDPDRRERPWQPAQRQTVANMRAFFEYVQERYIGKGLEVRFSRAADAAADFRAVGAPPRIPSETASRR